MECEEQDATQHIHSQPQAGTEGACSPFTPRPRGFGRFCATGCVVFRLVEEEPCFVS